MNVFSSFFKRNNSTPSGAPSKDPVCGMRPTDSITHKHEGITYKFCSDYCKEQFIADPSAYI